MFPQELKYMKKNCNKLKKKKNGAAKSLANKSVFFSTASSAGPLTVATLHLEQKTRKILKSYIKYEVNSGSECNLYI